MPNISKASALDVSCLKIFNPSAVAVIDQALKDGKKVEKIESSFSDPGPDYVKFTVDGVTVCCVDGY